MYIKINRFTYFLLFACVFLCLSVRPSVTLVTKSVPCVSPPPDNFKSKSPLTPLYGVCRRWNLQAILFPECCIVWDNPLVSPPSPPTPHPHSSSSPLPSAPPLLPNIICVLSFFSHCQKFCKNPGNTRIVPRTLFNFLPWCAAKACRKAFLQMREMAWKKRLRFQKDP